MVALERPASSRFFFNLVSDTEVISDETGVDLSLEGDVVSAIARALEDLCQDGSFAAFDWDGWRMVVSDGTSQPVLSIALGRSSQDGNNPCTARDFKFLAASGMATS